MRYVWLLIFAVAMWLLMAFAVAVQAKLIARREGEEAGRVSVLAFATAPPAVFTGLAYLIDRARPGMGFWVVLGTHAFLGVIALAFALRGRAILARQDWPPPAA